MTLQQRDPGIDLVGQALAEQFWPRPAPPGGAPPVADPVTPPAAEPVVARAQSPTQAPTRRRILIEWTAILLVAFLVAVVLKAVVLQSYSIPSDSMVPTLIRNDRVLVNTLAYWAHDVRRGDVVVLDRPEGLPDTGGAEPDQLIKRVIGLPGDTIAARGGVVLINGRRLVEPYLPAGVETDRLDEAVRVPAGQVYLLGDNRSVSADSRVFGPVRISTIVGRAVARIWPPNRVGFL